MGVRVRFVVVALSLLAIAALAVPLALSLADHRTATLSAERGRQLATLADSAAMPNAPLDALVDRYHHVYGEGLLVVGSDGQTRAARGLSTSDPAAAAAVNLALVNAPVPRWGRIRPWDRHLLLATAGVRRDGELVGAVIVAVDTTVAARDIAHGWLGVAIGCLGLLLVAVLVARGFTRWVLRPITGLERAVADMTEGVAGPPADVAGPPELRHYTSAFNTMAEVVRASLDRQRRLVADASHQLRNPLTAVRLRADTLDDWVSEEGRSTYRSMTAELDRLENLLQQLLRLARAEQLAGSRKVGLSEAVAEPTELADVIEERIASWQPVADQKNQRLIYRDKDPGLAVQVARHDVEQLLDVAIDNALRYAGDDATVGLAAVRTADMVDLVVSDNGSGLPDEDLPRAATRFWRGRDDRKGTGLGLAIAGEIAAGHGGAITVERAPEGGLLVRYRLPESSTAPC